MAHHPELWKTIRWLAMLVSVLLLAWFGIRAFESTLFGTTSGLERGLDKILEALTHADTRIVEGRAEISDKADITELSLMEMKMSATRTFENERYVLKYLPAGTKRLIVRGEYRVTAGYRLRPGVSLRADGDIPVAAFPDPEILGVELIDFQILNERDGWFNSVTPEDRAQLLRELRQQMRLEAEKSGVLDIVESTLRTRLKDLLGVREVRIEKTGR